jgi:hypothetical protein
VVSRCTSVSAYPLGQSSADHIRIDQVRAVGTANETGKRIPGFLIGFPIGHAGDADDRIGLSARLLQGGLKSFLDKLLADLNAGSSGQSFAAATATRSNSWSAR